MAELLGANHAMTLYLLGISLFQSWPGLDGPGCAHDEGGAWPFMQPNIEKRQMFCPQHPIKQDPTVETSYIIRTFPERDEGRTAMSSVDVKRGRGGVDRGS